MPVVVVGFNRLSFNVIVIWIAFFFMPLLLALPGVDRPAGFCFLCGFAFFDGRGLFGDLQNVHYDRFDASE